MPSIKRAINISLSLKIRLDLSTNSLPKLFNPAIQNILSFSVWQKITLKVFYYFDKHLKKSAIHIAAGSKCSAPQHALG